MEGFKNFSNYICNIVLCMLALICIMTATGIIEFENVLSLITEMFILNNMTVIIICSVVVILTVFNLCIKNSKAEDIKSGVAIKQDGGTVYLAKDTFENIVLNITKSYASLKNVKVSITISEQGIIANIYAYILPDTIVQTVSVKLQENVKASILNQTTVEIKEVNLKVKGVYINQEKKV